MIRAGRIARRSQRASARLGIAKLVARQAGEFAPGRGEGSVAHDAGRRRRRDAVVMEQVARQIDPPDPGILVDIAGDVGELQRPSEMMGDGLAVRARLAEDRDAEAADGRGDAVAIEIEGGAVRGDDRAFGIHLHAVDDGQEVGPVEAEGLDRRRPERGRCAGAARRHKGHRSRAATRQVRPGASVDRARRRRCRRQCGRRHKRRKSLPGDRPGAAASPNRRRCLPPGPGGRSPAGR